MSRVAQSCMSASASGPRTSYLRSGERSVTTARSRQAQYSPIAPWAGKSCASQYPLYSTKFRVCAAKQSWNPVFFVIRTSASAVIRNPAAGLKSSFRSYTRTWTSVGFHPFAGSTSHGQAVEKQTRSVRARMSTKSPGRDQGSSIPMALASSSMVLKKKLMAGHPPRGRMPKRSPSALMLSEQFAWAGVSQILVVTRGAREAEGIVAPAGILDELQQRLVIDGVVLRIQTGTGIERAIRERVVVGSISRSRPPVEGAQAERLEVAALAPLHVHDLENWPALTS